MPKKYFIYTPYIYQEKKKIIVNNSMAKNDTKKYPNTRIPKIGQIIRIICYPDNRIRNPNHN